MTSTSTNVGLLQDKPLQTLNEQKYMLPSTKEEIDRLNTQHYLLRHALGGNFRAPMKELLERGIRVIDVGCGSGRWCVEMAQEFPQSSFVGVDMAEVFPKTDLPPNCSFTIGNTLKRLPFEDATFDYVFERLMTVAFTPADWDRAIIELLRIAKPGGMVELIESNVKLERPPPSFKWFTDALTNGALARGIDTSYATDHLEALLVKGGLENVKVDYVTDKLGWGGPEGIMAMDNMERLIGALRGTALKDMTDDEYTKLIQTMRSELKEYETRGRIYYGYGTKPVESGEV